MTDVASGINKVNDVVNRYLQPSSLPIGVSTAILTFFSSRLAPKLPDSWYKILDNNFVKVIAIFILVNHQLRLPTLSIAVAVLLVFGMEWIVKTWFPDTPPLSEVLKPDEDTKKDTKACNCFCNTTIQPTAEQWRALKSSPKLN